MNRTKEELYDLQSESRRRLNELSYRYGRACKEAQAIFIEQERAAEDCHAYRRLIRDYDKLTRTLPLDVDFV
jgi:hypothetical protein